MRLGCIAALALLGLSAGGTAKADTKVDWQRGLVLATAGAPADLRAPTTELARVKAERVATKRCRERLREAAKSLPLAGAESVGKTLGERFDEIVFGLITMRADHGSDGSVVVTMALPIDRLRTLRYGSDVPQSSDDVASTAATVIDARKLRLSPAVGLGINAGGETFHLPTLYVRDQAAAAVLAPGAEKTVVAQSAKSGVITLGKAVEPEKLRRSSLVVVIYSEKK